MKLRALMLIVTAGLLVAAANAQDDAKKEKLVGTWDAVSVTVDGKARPEDEVKKSKMIFTGDKITILREGRKDDEGTYKIDSTKKPKHIDLTPTTGGEAGKTMQGIYELEGDTLKICFGRPDRPKELASKEGGETVLIVLKRAK
jgi:uncharacterized protein (TIGR03067 family)